MVPRVPDWPGDPGPGQLGWLHALPASGPSEEFFPSDTGWMICDPTPHVISLAVILASAFRLQRAYKSLRICQNTDSDSVHQGWGLTFCIPNKRANCLAIFINWITLKEQGKGLFKGIL